MENHSPFNAKDDPQEMSLHDSVISGLFGTRSVCVLADISRFAKSGVLGIFQRRFLYQAVLLWCGHRMWVISAGSSHFHQLPLCREQSSKQQIELYFKCTLLLYPSRRGGSRAQTDNKMHSWQPPNTFWKYKFCRMFSYCIHGEGEQP